MLRPRKTLPIVMLFVALAVDAIVGCATGDDPGSSLNPQPLPPKAPPDDGRKTDEPQTPGGFDGEHDDTAASDGASTGSPDAGGASSGTPPADAGGN